VVDRIGPRTTLMASLALLAAGYGGFPFVRHPWQALVLAAIAGAGNGGFAPSHSSLLAALTSREQRTAAYALQRATDNLGFGVGGLAGGLIATTRVPESFTLLFALDAGTFIAFIALLAFVPKPTAPAITAAIRATGRYATVLRDRAFLWLLVVVAVLVAAAYAQISTVLPPFVKEHASVSEAGIGVTWMDPAAVEPAGAFAIQLLIRTRAINGSGSVMGTTIGDAHETGGSAFVYYDRVLQSAHEREQDAARLLAYAIAHEMGHLLLPPPAHSPSGIMRPEWDGDDLRHIASGSLQFTAVQVNAIRAKVSGCCAAAVAGTSAGLP